MVFTTSRRLFLKIRILQFSRPSISLLIRLAVLAAGTVILLTHTLGKTESASKPASVRGTSASAGIRQIALTTKDLVYDPTGQRIYASLPSTAANGNSIAQIDPLAGTVGTPIPLGSEPGKLVISANSQYIYASLDGAAAVRRFDLATQAAELLFTLGSDPFFGNYYVDDIAVMPGQPQTVAIARKYQETVVGEANVAIYDNGAVRANTTPNRGPGATVIEFGSSPTTLYGYENSSSDFGFRTMPITSSGVSISSTLHNYISGFGVDIRAAGGLIYATSGRVLNPATNNLAGTFPGIPSGSLVFPDLPTNRVYFLTGSGASTTLKAFDLGTFMLTGTLSIPGVSGTPGSLIKWGSDGLAFRTSGNQVFLLSTADIVPVSPSATPTPVAVASGITRLPLTTNDIVFDQNTQKVYASVPSTSGTFGNSLVPIDPQNGLIGPPVFVGSEPKRLAISDNGQFIYVAIDGAALVRKFDVGSQSAGLQFGFGSATTFGPMVPDDMAVVPGSPSSLVVARGNGNPPFDSVAAYDDGIQRGNGAQSGKAIEFSSSPGTLYGYSQSTSFHKLALSASGVSIISSVGQFISGDVDIRYDGGRLYATSGDVYDPEALTLLGTLSGGAGLVVPDSSTGRVYCLTGLGSSTLTLKSFDTNTFAQNGTLTISGVSGTPGSFIKAGANTLAFRTPSQAYFVQISAMTAMTSIPTPTQVATGIIQLPVAANDLVYDPTTQKVYASLPGNAGNFGNSLAPIDPITGIMSTPIFVGSEPRKLAISSNNQFIYSGLEGVGGVRRFDLASQTAGLQFSLGSGQFSGRRYVDDMAVLPDNPNAVAIARRSKTTSPRHDGVIIYDGDVPRPNATSGASLNEVIEFSAAPSKLLGFNNESTEFGLHKLIINSAGVSLGSTVTTSLGGFGADMKYSNGNLYSSAGRAVNAETGAFLGAFPGVNTFAFVPDAAVRRVYYITGTGVATTIQAFDQQTFTSVGSLIIPGVNGTATNMIRWGVDGLAFITSGNQVFFVQTSLIPAASMSATSTALTSSLNPANAGQTVTFTANVTATAGTPTGTVQFQDGGLNLGSPQPLVNGTASVSTSTLNGGLRSITADYSGDSNFLVSGGAVAQSVLPLLSINDASTTEGQSGSKSLNFTVALSQASNQTVTVSYATANGTATAGPDYSATNGLLTFNPGDLTKNIAVTINSDQSFETDETFVVTLSGAVNASLNRSEGTGTILNDDAQGGFISFTGGNYSGSESTGVITVTVVRSNDTSRAATIDYATSDTGAPAACATMNGLASGRCDFTTTLGTLRYAAGETLKTFVVLVNRDSYTEGSEMFGITLANPTGGAIITGPSTVLGTIFNSTNPVGTPSNIVDDATFFVRQHYHDFLNRQPDASGLAYWTNQITECQQPGATCNAEVRRINVSAAFFLSIEFQETGYLIERIYKSAYGDFDGSSGIGGAHLIKAPIIKLNEFLADSQQIGKGVVVGADGWQTKLENNKVAFTQDFVIRSRFVSAYPTTMTPAEFVDQHFLNALVTPDATERISIINEFGGTGNTVDTAARARALRRVAENTALAQQEKNKAFVLMQFFGYLRRNPNDPQDSDHTGYDFWLQKLNQFNGNFEQAEMVKAFLDSTEYRARFGP